MTLGLTLGRGCLITRFVTAVLATMPLAACAPELDASKTTLPEPGFEIDQTRSDGYRAAREFRDTYRGPLFDVQAHIRRPKGDRGDYLKKVMGVMARVGVTRMLVMSTPNEGRRASHEEWQLQVTPWAPPQVVHWCRSALVRSTLVARRAGR